jgi:hypothetical protein
MFKPPLSRWFKPPLPLALNQCGFMDAVTFIRGIKHWPSPGKGTTLLTENKIQEHKTT